MTIEEDVEELSQLLTDKLGGQEALDRIVVYLAQVEASNQAQYEAANRYLEELNTELEYGGRALAEWQRENDALREERDELREALERAAAECESLAPAWFGSGRGSLQAIAIRARSALQRTEGEVTATSNRP